MNPNDVIDFYVTDVAVHLPRRQRNDVAFELSALLREGLQGRAEAVGGAADVSMAIEFLREFGPPSEVAARYRRTLTIIDPADGPGFLRATVIGLAVIWSLGLLRQLLLPTATGLDMLDTLQQWWGTTVISSLWWPGVLVVGFGAAAWARRRWPRSSEWTPPAGNRTPAGRTALMLGLVGIGCGLLVLLEPRWILDVLFGGRAAAAAYAAFTYTQAFRQRQAPVLLVLILLNVPLLVAVIVSGRWSAGLRRVATGLSLVTCATLTWVVLDGPMFLAPGSDRTAKFLIVLIVATTLIDFALELWRRVRPTPNLQARA